MLDRRLFLLSAAGAVTATATAAKPKVGPAAGSLVVVGGGTLPDVIVQRFIDLAGGPEAPFVFIPTAGEAANYDQAWVERQFLSKAGVRNVTLLHTRDRKATGTE